MTLKNEIHDQLTTARRSGDKLRRSILQVFLGEIQKLDALAKNPITDDQIHNIARKLIKGNEDLRGYLEREKSDVKIQAIDDENEILNQFLPQTLDEEALLAELTKEPIKSQLLGAKSDGQATGLAMKHFKTNNIAVVGNEVSLVVAQVRSPSPG